MRGKLTKRLFRKFFIGGIVLEDGITKVAELRAAIPKRLPRNAIIEYCEYRDDDIDGISLIFSTEEEITGDEAVKFRKGIERIRKKFDKEELQK